MKNVKDDNSIFPRYPRLFLGNDYEERKRRLAIHDLTRPPTQIDLLLVFMAKSDVTIELIMNDSSITSRQ
jgi:hypothetical protein